MFQISHLVKEFNSVHAVHDVTTQICQGEVVFVVGPSGSGKSTFLRCLNLLEEPTSGEIRFKGELINAPHADVNKFRQHVGMVFQHFNLFPHLTILENITIAPVKTGRAMARWAASGMNWGDGPHKAAVMAAGCAIIGGGAVALDRLGRKFLTAEAAAIAVTATLIALPGCRSAPRAMPMTRAPMAWPSCTAVRPTPPAAPSTASVSPARSPPRPASARWLVP